MHTQFFFSLLANFRRDFPLGLIDDFELVPHKAIHCLDRCSALRQTLIDEPLQRYGHKSSHGTCRQIMQTEANALIDILISLIKQRLMPVDVHGHAVVILAQTSFSLAVDWVNDIV